MNKRMPLLLTLLSACTPHINGLMPVEPAPDGSTVRSLRPLLRWEPLPEAGDPRITEMVYDVRVRNASGGLHIEREGLTSCEYRIETPLIGNHDYQWTVRARFRWEGRRRQTEWSRLSSPDDRLAVRSEAPARYLPFRTPPSEDSPPAPVHRR